MTEVEIWWGIFTVGGLAAALVTALLFLKAMHDEGEDD